MGRTWLLNLDCESELAAPRGYQPRQAVLEAFEPYLVHARTLLQPGDAELPDRAGASGRAWCPTPSALARLHAAGLEVEEAPSLDVLRHANDKSRQPVDPRGLAGTRCFQPESVEELEAHLSGLTGDFVLKRAWSVAGLLDEKHQHYSENRLGRHEDLTALLKREPDAMMRRFELANTMTRSGNYDDAFYKYTTCFEAQPDFVLAYYNMGELWHLNGRTKQAIPWLKRALKHVDTLR